MKLGKGSIGVFCLSAALWACEGIEENTPARTGYAELAGQQQAAVDHFLAHHADRSEKEEKDTLLLCREADLNADGILDVVLLYAPAPGTRPVPGHEGNALCVLLSTPAGYVATNSLPAPQERQSIQFRDIDGKPPVECIVSGFKGAKSGIGVYRVQGTSVELLFGGSMDECC